VAPTPAASPALSFAREARDRIAAALGRSSRSSRTITLSAPAAGRLELRFLDARRRAVARRTVTYPKAGARTVTIRPGKAKSISVRWIPEQGAPQRAERQLRARRGA
jgi:hypothetical protein